MTRRTGGGAPRGVGTSGTRRVASKTAAIILGRASTAATIGSDAPVSGVIGAWQWILQRFASCGFAPASRFVPGAVYPVAVARVSLILAGLGLAALLLTAVVVDRRRPYA